MPLPYYLARAIEWRAVADALRTAGLPPGHRHPDGKKDGVCGQGTPADRTGSEFEGTSRRLGISALIETRWPVQNSAARDHFCAPFSRRPVRSFPLRSPNKVSRGTPLFIAKTGPSSGPKYETERRRCVVRDDHGSSLGAGVQQAAKARPRGVNVPAATSVVVVEVRAKLDERR